MAWSLVQSIFYGLVAGVTAILPVSSDAHCDLLAEMYGADGEEALFRLLCRAAALAAVLLACREELARYRRQRRMAAQRGKRQSDRESLLDLRVLRAAAVCLLPVALVLGILPLDGVWLTVAMLVLNGVVLFYCRLRPVGNRDSRHMSGLDAAALGAAVGLGTVTGLSGLGLGMATCRLRGGERRYSLEMALLLTALLLAVLLIFDAVTLLSAGVVLSAWWLLCYLVAALASALGAYGAVSSLRYLALHTDFSGFAYYCWGAALFILLLYLIV